MIEKIGYLNAYVHLNVLYFHSLYMWACWQDQVAPLLQCVMWRAASSSGGNPVLALPSRPRGSRSKTFTKSTKLRQIWNPPVMEPIYATSYVILQSHVWFCRGPDPAMHNVYCVTTAYSPSCVYCTFLGEMLFKARNWIYSTAVLTNVPNLDGIMIGPAFTWALQGRS